MNSPFTTSLQQKILAATIDRLPTLNEHFNRARQCGLWPANQPNPKLPFIEDHWLCEEPGHLINSVYHSLFGLTDEEKKEFCNVLMGVKND